MKTEFLLPENPFIQLIIPFLAGIFLGVAFPFDQYLSILSGSIYAIALLFFTLNFGFKSWKIYRNPWIGGVLINIFLLLIAILFAENFKEINQPNHFSKQKADVLIVQIIQEPKQTNDIVRFNSLVTHTVFNGKISRCSGSLLIALRLDSNQISQYNYGDELLISNNYKPIDAPFNPAEFNYKLWLLHQNIYFQTFINPNQVRLIAIHKGNPIVTYALKVRKQLVSKLQKYMHNLDAISVASTLILGYRADLSQDVLQAYSKTGTMHVLSVSGMHVALVYIIIDLLLRFLNRRRSGIILKAIISILLIWIYALITGFSPAVCRAAVMITFVIAGKSYNRHISMLNILLVSAFGLLIYNPFFIADVGFQLSYLAVFGLITLQPIIQNLITFKQTLLHKLWSLLSVSLAAQIITFPISIFYFHQFPVYFLISNLFILLPSALIMYIGIGFLLLPSIDAIMNPLGFILEQTIVLMNNGLLWIENIPFGNWNKLWITVPEYLLLYSIIGFSFGWIIYRKPNLLKYSAVFTMLFLASFSYKRFDAGNQHEIVFLNLRKNTGIIFKNGTQAIVMSDLKTTEKAFKYTIQPYLDSCKIVNFKQINCSQNFKNAVFNRQKKLIQFKNQLIFVADKDFEKQHFPQKIKVDAVFITQNPRINLEQITRNLIFETLILDAQNSDFLIKKLSSEAVLDSRKIKVLKRNKAIILYSN